MKSVEVSLRVLTRFLTVLVLALGALPYSFGDVPSSPGSTSAAPDSAFAVPSELSLNEALRIAFARNWDLLAAKSNVDAATAQRIIAKEFPNPTLDLGLSKINVDNRGSGTAGHVPRISQSSDALATAANAADGLASIVRGPSSASPIPSAHVPTLLRNGFWDRSYDTVIAVNQLFEIGGKRSARVKSAKAGIEEAAAQLKDAKRILDNGVIKAYVAALLASNNVTVLRQSAESLRKEADLAALREKTGDISKSDRTQIEVDAARFEQDTRTAEGAALAARIALETLIGAPNPTGAWTPLDSLDALADFEPPLPDAAAAERRPDLLAAQAALDKAESDLALQRAMRIPDPTVTLGYEHQPPDQPNTLNLGVSLPLPVRHQFQGEIRAAQVARDDAARAVAKTRAQIAADQAQARNAYEKALARWREYHREICPKSSQVRESVRFSYEKGGASLLDLLSAERTDNDVRLASVQAAADTVSAASDLAAAFNTAFTKDKELTP